MRTLLFLLSIGVFVSCSDDFLNPNPTDAVQEEEVFESYKVAEAALVGAYDQLSAYTFEGHYVPLMSDIMGEDVMINSVDNWGWFVEVYQMNVLPNYNYVSNPWSVGYKVIYDANRIVAEAQNISGASQEEMNNLEGQAKVIRAFSMLKLVEMYAPAYVVNPDAPGIMNVNKPVNATSEDFGRAPVREVYNQIVSDLTSAVDLLDSMKFKGVFDKKGAQAVLARTYLDMQDWEKARDMAKAAYKGMDLMDIDELLGGFYASNSETIFSVAYTAEDNNTYLSIPSFYWPVSGYSSMRADTKFVESFSDQDYRRFQFLMQEDIDEDNYLILKFEHNQQVGNAERISIRASEMYLIEAECEAELANTTAAQEALYIVQSRANPGVAKSTATGQALIDEVLMERRKELFGEGFRWNDIKRRNLPFKREGDHWVKFDFGPDDADYFRLTFPIPQSEIDRNSKFSQEDQNIGY